MGSKVFSPKKDALLTHNEPSTVRVELTDIEDLT